VEPNAVSLGKGGEKKPTSGPSLGPGGMSRNSPQRRENRVNNEGVARGYQKTMGNRFRKRTAENYQTIRERGKSKKGGGGQFQLSEKK